MANKKSRSCLFVLFFVCFSLIIDREGSKSQLRHTEPPREKRKRKKMEREKEIQNVGEKEKKRKTSVQRNLCNSCSTLHSSKNNNNLLCDLFIYFISYLLISFFFFFFFPLRGDEDEVVTAVQ